MGKNSLDSVDILEERDYNRLLEILRHDGSLHVEESSFERDGVQYIQHRVYSREGGREGTISCEPEMGVRVSQGINITYFKMRDGINPYFN